METIDNAFLVLADGKIQSFGEMRNLNEQDYAGYDIIDATDRYVLPAWCDSHTHLVYSQSR